MELTMTNCLGFCELNEQEMLMVDGGAVTTTTCKFIVSVTVGTAVSIGVTKLGAKIGGTAGAVIGGPVGAIIGGAIGAGLGLLISNAIID